jgi:thymidylate kinase
MKPALIGFMGLDGSGKSTSISYAYEQLKKRGYDAEIVRAAYVIKYMSAPVKLCKGLLMRKQSSPFSGDYRAYLEKMRGQARRRGVYAAFSFLTACEFKLQILLNIRLKRMMGKTLLIDRYVYDNVVTCAANLGLGEDYMRKTMEGKWRNAPKPDGIIYIKTPVEVCCSRKDDIPDPLYLEIREPLYDEIASLYHAVTVRGDQDRQRMFDQVMNAVEACLVEGRPGIGDGLQS